MQHHLIIYLSVCHAHTKAESMEVERAQCKTGICSGGSKDKNEVFETDSLENKWTAIKEAWQKTTE